MKIIKKVRAPVRIDFAGGTTDIKPFTDIYGGAVLNATINRYVFGSLIATDYFTKLEYHANIPTSSGLGTSSAMNDVWVALITHMKDKEKISQSVFKIEQSISESAVNGKQDMYAACYGGINFMEFKGDKVNIQKLNLKDDLIKELENRLVLIYSGKPHLSGNSNKAAIDNLIKGAAGQAVQNMNIMFGFKETAGLEELPDRRGGEAAHAGCRGAASLGPSFPGCSRGRRYL